MCGFSGFISSQTFPEGSASLLWTMGQAIHYRGPDDRGYWVDESAGVGLSHQRLSVVDVSPAGHQPMHSACGRYVIAFNGEIYNHHDLRARLESAGEAPVWCGHSDTETLLACFVAWGIEKTLQATVGMFAIALWDRQERVLTLVRDRLGEKPLYWGWQDGVLLFASELKALKAHPACKAEVDRNALALLLRYNYIPAPSSIYKGIEKLRPGHYVSISLNAGMAASVQSMPYWQINQVVEQGQANLFTGSDDEAIDLLEQRLTQSIAGQMLADVPLGAFLSGGVDSSSVVALMQRQSSQPVRTFAIGFNESDYNEAEHALAVARHLGTDHTELYVGAADVLAVIPKLPHIYCEPFADSSQIPTYLVSQMAKQKVTVALSGDGGDELFGGYNPYQFAPRVWRAMSQMPLMLRKLAVNVLAGLPLPDKLGKLLSVLPANDREAFYVALMSHWQEPEQVVIGAVPSANSSALHFNLPQAEDFAHWMMAMDAKQYMADDILVKVDRAAMANSLETRVPLLDHRVVDLAWQLPLHMKIRDGKGKWVLREVLYRHVPRELIERPKKGFSIPLAQWLRGPLRDWAETLLGERRLREEGYFIAKPIRRLWSEHLSGKRDNALRLWGILMFQAWLERERA